MVENLKRITSTVVDDLKSIRDRSIVENLKRYRELVAWITVASIAGGLVLGLVRLVMLLTLEREPVFAAFQDVGNSIMSPTLVVVQVVLVWTCLFVAPSTPHAVALTRLSAWVVTVGTVLTLVCTVLGLSASAGAFLALLEFLGGLLDIILKALASGILWIVTKAVSAGRIEIPSPPEPVTADEPGAGRSSAPAWRPEEAAGAVWRTAEEAAAGAAGESGVAGTGWAVSSSEESLPQPPRPAMPASSPGRMQEVKGPESRQWKPISRSDTSEVGKVTHTGVDEDRITGV